MSDDTDELPPGLEDSVSGADDSDALPPGLADDDDRLPPGLADDDDQLPPGLADDDDELPPGLADPKPKPKDPAKVAEAQKARARELWERLAKSRPGPNNKDLMYLARFVPLLSSAAVKTLLGRKLSLEELKELVQHVPKAQEAATKQIIKNFSDDLTEEDLRFLFTQTKVAGSRQIPAQKISQRRKSWTGGTHNRRPEGCCRKDAQTGTNQSRAARN